MHRRILVGFLAMVTVIVAGSTGYWLIGGGRWSWFDCLYMTVITITTVGYSETLDGMDSVPYARAFTVVQLVFGTGVLVYFASTVTAFIVEGDLRNALTASRLKKRIRRMQDHAIVCGAGSTGKYIIEELIASRVPVVAIDLDEHELRDIAIRHPRAAYSYIVGDATDDEILAASGLSVARGMVIALASDKDNLYIVIAARFAGSQARIVARASTLGHVEKFKRVGADAVVTVDYIGGRRIVSEMLRPSVARFLDAMLRDDRDVYRIDEVTIEAGSDLDGKPLEEASLHERFGVGVLAISAGAEQPWSYNPEPGERLAAGTIVVILGSISQITRVRAAAR